MKQNKKECGNIYSFVFFLYQKEKFHNISFMLSSMQNACDSSLLISSTNFLVFWHRAESDAKTNPSTRKTCIHFQKMLYCLEKVGSVLSSCGKISQKHHL